MLLSVVLVISCHQQKTNESTTSAALETHVERAILELSNIWYPKTIDSLNGGFWSDFDYQWKKKGKQNKFLVSQARHVWTAATLTEFHNDERYTKIAAHGVEFLKNKMWDSLNGGFHSLFEIGGDSLQLLSNGKSAYGNSFAIYGLATYYKVSKDTLALELAKKTFHWLEEHARDSVYGGYFDVLAQDGSWLLKIAENNKNYPSFIRKDWKDQNSSIHLLESYTSLYEVWPDELLKKRLQELLILIRDTITTEKGHLTLHLHRDWTPVSLRDSSEAYRKDHFYLDHVSFGHDIETAFLMLEASHVLGLENDSTTHSIAKKMVDHGIKNGWDKDIGGFFEGGYYFDQDICSVENKSKIWWTQAECLNSLLLLAQLYPEEKRYHELFERQWSYIQDHMVDKMHGGWFSEGLDSNPQAREGAKAHIWKVNYHNLRSLINVSKMLKGEFALTKPQ